MSKVKGCASIIIIQFQQLNIHAISDSFLLAVSNVIHYQARPAEGSSIICKSGKTIVHISQSFRGQTAFNAIIGQLFRKLNFFDMKHLIVQPCLKGICS